MHELTAWISDRKRGGWESEMSLTDASGGLALDVVDAFDRGAVLGVIREGAGTASCYFISVLLGPAAPHRLTGDVGARCDTGEGLTPPGPAVRLIHLAV